MINPAPGLLTDAALSIGDEFLKFVAFGFKFDHEIARKEVTNFASIKNTNKESNELSSPEQHVDYLSEVISSSIEKIIPEHEENWLGLSSGFDSRYLLHHLRKKGKTFSSFTFGQPGYADYDLSGILSEKFSLNTRLIDLGTLEWNLQLYEEIMPLTLDWPVHPRVISINQLAHASKSKTINLIHGYLNGELITTHNFSDWEDAVVGFINSNDQYQWQFEFNQRWLREQLPNKALLEHDELPYYDQLSLAYRQAQRIKPSNYKNINFLTPFDDESWIGYWLNRSTNERNHYRLWLNLISLMEYEDFFDLNSLIEKNIEPNKENQMRILYGQRGLVSSEPSTRPLSPYAQICYYAVYQSNPSFKLFIDKSLRRLREKNIFRPRAIDNIYSRFLDGQFKAEKMIRGLVTTDIALESGLFNHVYKNATMNTVKSETDQSTYNLIRTEWLDFMWKIASPVLENGSEGKLKQNMPVEGPAPDQRRQFSHLEAVGRTLSGIAPWLELSGLQGDEAVFQARVRQLAQSTIVSITDKSSPDFLNFDSGEQPLVDAALLALAILRAPNSLLIGLPEKNRQNIFNVLSATRIITPYYNNWLLFSAMIEAFFCKAGLQYDAVRIDYAFKQMEQWYVGDGLYSDGPVFHADYYNSYVIHPFLLTILAVTSHTRQWNDLIPKQLKRAQRYCELLERSISPEGTMPVIGRSLTYRCGNLHSLGQLALADKLPAGLSSEQVRCAMSPVIQRTIEATGTFDEDGWLNIGLYGDQPGLAEDYVSTGSLYWATLAFLPLGLHPDSPFWSNPDVPFTSQKLYSGIDASPDKAYDGS